MTSKFIPASVVSRPAWSTPGYFPDEKKFTPYTVVANGISAQSQRQLKEMELREKPVMLPTPSQQTMESTKGMIQLPNGQFVTPQQYQQLMQILNRR